MTTSTAKSAPPAPTPGKADRTRQRLVAAVRQEVESTGGFTADGVARRVGSSAATFYNHFASKDDALRAAFAAAMAELVEFVSRELQIERVLEAGLDAFALHWAGASADFFRENSVVFRAAGSQLPLSKDLREVYRAQEEAALERYERFVRLGQTARLIRAGDASAIAQALMIFSEGWNNPRVLKMKTQGALHRELAGSVVRMLAPRPGEDALD
jgi:AcrR family transcriptional regulator